jgi:glycosyltransferase involved in cell wall biosynthesis
MWRQLDPVPLLVIAGEGRERSALQRRIRNEDLPARLVGGRDDIAELLAAADLAVLPSRWEARSVPAQEALRLGVPLVATAVGGVPELVGDAAELVPYGNAEALARVVARLLGDPAARERMAAAGRVQAASWPTEDDTIAQVLSVYDELTQPLATRGR